MTDPLLIANALVTGALVGLIWTIQVVHYPLFARVGPERFAAYEAEHARRITFVVGPLMLAELVVAAALPFVVEGSNDRLLAWIGLALVVAVWIVTAFVSVPCHRCLAAGFDERAHRRLVATNWLRTLAWTARGAIAGLLLWTAQASPL
ncbi:MAG: hypothetical protein JNM94_07905 [Phycisphaerae bacterium]|nr:hypothetical protein [Phycisphaerae bacterium]